MRQNWYEWKIDCLKSIQKKSVFGETMQWEYIRLLWFLAWKTNTTQRIKQTQRILAINHLIYWKQKQLYKCQLPVETALDAVKSSLQTEYSEAKNTIFNSTIKHNSGIWKRSIGWSIECVRFYFKIEHIQLLLTWTVFVDFWGAHIESKCEICKIITTAYLAHFDPL